MNVMEIADDVLLVVVSVVEAEDCSKVDLVVVRLKDLMFVRSEI